MRNAPHLLAALALAAVPATAFAAQPVTGRWVTDDGKAVVTIGTCGSTICGKVTKILAATPKGPPVDENNPDPKLRHRPIEGLQILSGFKADGDSWKGRIYSPEEGKTYKSVMSRAGPDTIKVKGCVLFFCKTQTWSKAG
ncbi:DUF2147 domain-containing protein [Sphingomonas oligophenolica]|uniref:DUF2147 domain-containing protein n=1 Tax=Sphingomonas oligophenolica TaxID=301154 RepID=A0A502C6D3_9SPHN|nr:DUF2147 domain-containing protein [Sphingomonas oligophenolica]TPG08468.1 DUF2147 domain-containing protein [Sphingomonas oligophenolica]